MTGRNNRIVIITQEITAEENLEDVMMLERAVPSETGHNLARPLARGDRGT